MFVGKLVHRWAFKFNFKNPSSLVNLYSKDAILLPTFNKNIIHDKKEMKDYFENLKNDNIFVRIRNVDERICYGTDIEYGEYDFIINGRIHKARYNFVMTEEDGEMKILFHQSSLIP